MVICLKRDANLHVARLMPLPLTISCFSKIQVGFTFLVPANLGSPGKRAIKRVCVCTYKMAAKTNWHRHGTKLPHCHPMYITHPNIKVALAQQGAEVIVKIECYFIHLICVCVHWKHTPSTVRDLYVNSTPTTQSRCATI